MHNTARLAGLVACLLVLLCCEQQSADKPQIQAQPSTTVKAAPLKQVTQQQLQLFQVQSHDLLKALAVCTQTLTTLGQQFLDKATEDNLQLVKNQWQACWQSYQASTTLLGFDAEQQKSLNRLHGNLGKKLQMPGYIDSVEGYPHSGIVNDASLTLDAENLRQQHGLTHPSDVSIGFDVIAFLLWGEHRYGTGIPARPAQQFKQQTRWHDSRTDLAISEHPNNRRRRLLEITLNLAQEDTQALQAAWIKNELPDTDMDAQAWKRQQLQRFIRALNQQPDNEQLTTHLLLWYEKGALPGLSPEPNPTSEITTKQLLSQLESTLTKLISQQL